MGVTKFVALLVVASFIQVGEAQNFHYINEVQHGNQYTYNGSVRYMNAIPIVVCSLVIGYCLQFFPGLLHHHR